jgi:hypothetical protein
VSVFAMLNAVPAMAGNAHGTFNKQGRRNGGSTLFGLVRSPSEKSMGALTGKRRFRFSKPISFAGPFGETTNDDSAQA